MRDGDIKTATADDMPILSDRKNNETKEQENNNRNHNVGKDTCAQETKKTFSVTSY